MTGQRVVRAAAAADAKVLPSFVRVHRKLAAAAPDQVRLATYAITHCTYRTNRASMQYVFVLICAWQCISTGMWQEVHLPFGVLTRSMQGLENKSGYY